MKLHRFIGDFDLQKSPLELNDTELVHQIVRVLRLQIGERLVLCDGKGEEAQAEIMELTPRRVTALIVEKNKNNNEPMRHVVLYCAILKRENFELVVQKATEVGASEIVPILSRRTIKQNLKMDRLQHIVKEAAEQSGRGIVPVVHAPVTLEQAIEAAEVNDVNYFFDVRTNPAFAGAETVSAPAKIGLFIGPEGGWDEDERLFASSAGCELASLGKLTLRAETAAIVATYLISSQFSLWPRQW